MTENYFLEYTVGSTTSSLEITWMENVASWLAAQQALDTAGNEMDSENMANTTGLNARLHQCPTHIYAENCGICLSQVLLIKFIIFNIFNNIKMILNNELY